MSAKQTIDIKQLRSDLETLSAQDFEFKYPGLSTKTLRGLTVEELEQRVSKIKVPTGGGGHTFGR